MEVGFLCPLWGALGTISEFFTAILVTYIFVGTGLAPSLASQANQRILIRTQTQDLLSLPGYVQALPGICSVYEVTSSFHFGHNSLIFTIV